MPVFQVGHPQSSVSDDMNYGASMMSKSSWMTFVRRAKQVVVQGGLLTILRLLSYFSWLREQYGGWEHQKYVDIGRTEMMTLLISPFK